MAKSKPAVNAASLPKLRDRLTQRICPYCAAAAVIFAAFRFSAEDPAGPLALQVAGKLGSDVAFFLTAADTGFGLASGRGECIAPAELGSRPWVALLTPGFGASTAAVYGALGSREPLAEAPTEPQVPFAPEELHNDLEAAALEVVPGLADLRVGFDRAGLSQWRLSGSGSSLFGLYSDGAQAARDLQVARTVAQQTTQADVDPLRLSQVTRIGGHGIRELLFWPPSGTDVR